VSRPANRRGSLRILRATRAPGHPSRAGLTGAAAARVGAPRVPGRVTMVRPRARRTPAGWRMRRRDRRTAGRQRKPSWRMGRTTMQRQPCPPPRKAPRATRKRTSQGTSAPRKARPMRRCTLTGPRRPWRRRRTKNHTASSGRRTTQIGSWAARSSEKTSGAEGGSHRQRRFQSKACFPAVA
jgi:hypothetical protein